MSLKVWLPLNGDLKNLGTDASEVTISSTQGSFISEGKIGKGFKTGSTGNVILGYVPNINTGSISFAGWFKFNKAEIAAVVEPLTYTSAYTTSSGNLIGNDSYGGIGLIWQTNNIYTTQSFDSLRIFSTLRTATVNKSTSSYTVEFDKWVHAVLTFEKSIGRLSLYINGDLFSYTDFTDFTNASTTVIFLNKQSTYGGNTNNPSLPFVTNDVRIYNHCLSKLEIKELSQGLVCHYKFDNIYNTNNLILNGNGELGSKHWSNATNISTTEIPPNQPIIKASFYSGNMTADYIEINKYSVYTINTYLKTTGGTTGTFYPSIYPYDYDKKFIANQNCTDGFSNTYKTTLAQPLKKGDTVIHATDLSAWTTGNNYFNYVAIFGYKNSAGFTYPDMQYTADSPAFATNADKSHLDKENNTITLNTAFTGEDRPAGTVICQASAGSTYYYPFGGVAKSSVQDWTLKTATLRPSAINRLRWAKYIKWQAYSGAYYAGNKLMDMTWWNNHIKDDSGNGYNLEVVNNLLADSDTPRYSYSTRFPLNTSYCRVTFPSVSGFANSYTFSWWGKSASTSTMMWGFANGNRLNLFLVNPVCWNTGDGSNNPFAGVSPITDNKFHYYTITGDGTTTKLYIDGEFRANAKTYKGITGTTLYFNGWDTSTKYKFCGCLSDFKLFATVLSADDIKRIYEEALSVGKLGDTHPYEIVEDTTNSINKAGVFTNEVFSENYLTEVSKYDNNLYIEPDGAVFVRICHHANTSNTSNLFASSNDFINGIKKNDNAWANFAIMNDCNSWEFMVKEKYESTDNERIYRWIQPVNPLTAVFADVAAANVTFNPDSRYYDDAFKGGIYHKGGQTYLSQNNGTSSSWWGAIGSWTAYNGGIPGFGNNQHVIKTGYMDLYIRIDNQLKLGDNVFKKYKHNNTWYSPCIIER